MTKNSKELIAENALGLPKEEVDGLTRKLESRAITYLSADKEVGPFLLYACGDSLLNISVKTGIPMDIVKLTAIQYCWIEKIRALGIANKECGVDWVAKDLANTFLVASSIVIKRKLGELIAGKTSAENSKLIPSDIYALDKMLRLINEIYKTTEAPNRTTNVIHADKVQVVNNGDTSKAKERLNLLKEIEDEEK